jgi:hypothetical protein
MRAAGENSDGTADSIARSCCIESNPVTAEEKNNTNGMKQALLACVDPNQDPTRLSAIADAFAQCAEDNCTSSNVGKTRQA